MTPFPPRSEAEGNLCSFGIYMSRDALRTFRQLAIAQRITLCSVVLAILHDWMEETYLDIHMMVQVREQT